MPNEQMSTLTAGGVTYEIVDKVAREKTEGIVTPQMFGAVGDGVHDDTVAIQAAINSGKRLNGVDGSKYNISNVDLSGLDNVMIDSCVFVGNTQSYMFKCNAKSVEITNSTFDGNNKAYGVFTEDTYSDSIYIANTLVTNMDAVIDNTWPTTRALRIYSKTARIVDSTVSNNSGHGMIFQLTEDINDDAVFSVDNCTADHNGSYGVSQGIGIGCLSGRPNNAKALIINCSANDNGASGIAPHGFNNVLVSNCIAMNNGEHGIVLMQSNDSIITGCVVKGNMSFGIRVQGDFSMPIEKRFCDNNLIKGCLVNQTNGIKVGVKTTNISISENVFLNTISPILTDESGTDSTRNNGSDNVIFSNNRIQHAGLLNKNDVDYFNNFIIKDNYYFNGQLYPNGKTRYTGSELDLYVSYGDCSDIVANNNLLTTEFKSLSSSVTYANNKITVPSSIATKAMPFEFRIPIVNSVITYFTIPSGFIPCARFRNSQGSLVNPASFKLYTYGSNPQINKMTVTVVSKDLSNIGFLCITFESYKTIDVGEYPLELYASNGLRLYRG